MNDETLLPGEVSTDPVSESTSPPDETEALETGDGTVTEETYEIPETVADVSTDEYVLEDSTEATEETISVVTPEHIQDAALTISGAVLFGAFLIAGILIVFRIMRVKDHG